MAADGGPDIMPDLSHLTEEERSIIEGVMRRQKIEEEQESELVRRKQDEVRVLENTIRLRSEVQRKKGLELDATCQICLKTKFADGVGHICNYCNVRCCARCGGKVSLRSNKVIWVCILCRKKQELLIKTGTWMNTGLPNQGEAMHLDHEYSGTAGSVTPTGDKRPKLERGASSEKENNRPPGVGGPAPGGGGPHQQGESASRHHQGEQGHHHAALEARPVLQRTGSTQGRELRRQYSQERGAGESGRPARGRATSEGGEGPPPSPHARERPVPPPEGFRSFEQQRPPGPDIRVERGYGGGGGYGGPGYGPNRYSPNLGGAGGSSPMEGSSPGPASLEGSSPHPEDTRRSHLDPSAGALGRPHGRRRTDPVMRNDSVSSDQSECVRPPPPKPHKSRSRGRKPRQRSLSSSDEEVRSTPEYTSCEEPEAESEGVSEKGEGEAVVADRYKRQEIVHATIKTLLAHPVSWKPSQDGTRLIGHLLLNKYVKGEVPVLSANILGLKVVGGKILDNGRIGALIEKVKKGSVADTVGHLRPGDEVLEWNGRSLQGKTFEEVFEITSESRQEPQVELMVSRQLSDVGRQPGRRHTHLGIGAKGEGYESRRLPEPRQDRRPSVTITSPGSPETFRIRTHSPSIVGKLQLKLWFDTMNQQLVVTIVSAVDLPPRPNGAPRNPYAKMFLLPDRSEKSKRRTKAMANTLDPRWNQSFYYCPLRRPELKTRSLEITVWDYDRYGANDFLGEVVVDLSAAPLDDEPDWHYLSSHDDALPSHMRRGMYVDTESASTIASTDHLSPPSTTSRLSESDISDLEDNLQRDRRTDGTSISSVGSSSSPPPEDRQLGSGVEHLPRRDTSSPTGRRLTTTVLSRGDLRYRAKDLTLPAYSNTRVRSHSAAPTDSPSLHMSRSRSKSPRRVTEPGSRSLSPPEARPGYSGGSRMASRSATATPTGSPKKRQLPPIPTHQLSSRDKVTQELEDRARQMKARMMQIQAHRSTGSGPSHMYSGHSDTELRTYDRYSQGRGVLVSPERDQDRDFGDSASDIESVVSAFSTQSERPRGSWRSSRRHLSSLKSHTHGYDATLDPPSLLTDVTRDISPSAREPSCSLLDVSLRPPSPIQPRPPHLRRSLSMGVGAGVSRSAPHLASRPRQHPQPRVLVRCNTEANVAEPPSTRHRLQKSLSLGENDRRWEVRQDADYFPEAWEFSNRARSKSLTRDDFSGRPPARKTVTYEDEVLRERLQEPPTFSRSSLSLDKSVPYESDLVVREHPQDPYVRKSRAAPEGYTQAPQQQQQQQQQQQPHDAARGLYRRRSSVRLTDGHSAGTYYGYDSDYSGAETEVFLPDRSLDRSFSLEQVDQRSSEQEFTSGDERRPAGEAALPAHSLLAMQEGSSQTLPRARRPSTAPARKVMIRANTESALFKGPSRSLRREVIWKPSRGEQDRIYGIYRESSVVDAPPGDRRLEAARGVHSNPALSRVLDGATCSSDDVFVPMEQRRQGMAHESDRDRRPVDPYDAPPPDDRRYHYTSLPSEQARARDHEDTRLHHAAVGEDRRPLDPEVLPEGARYLEHERRDDHRYVEQGPREEARYLEQPRDDPVYRKHGSREEVRFREPGPRDDEARYPEHDSREEVRYREHGAAEDARHPKHGPRGDVRFQEYDPRDEVRFREHDPREETRHRRHSQRGDARYLEDPREEARYRDHGSREEMRYREPGPREEARYQEYLPREEVRFQEPPPREEVRFQEPLPREEVRFQEPPPREEVRFQEPPPREEVRFQEPLPREEVRFQEPPPREEVRFQEPPPREEVRFKEPPLREEVRFQEPPPREEVRFQEPPPREDGRYREVEVVVEPGYREHDPRVEGRYLDPREEGRYREDRPAEGRYRELDPRVDSRYPDDGRYPEDPRDRADVRYRDQDPRGEERYPDHREAKYREPPYPEAATGARPRRPEREISRDDAHRDERYRQASLDQDRYRDERYRDASAMERDRYKDHGAIEKDRYKRWSSAAEDKYRESLDEREYRVGPHDKERFRSSVSLDQDRYRDQVHDLYREGSEGPERGYRGPAEDRKHYGSRRDLRDRRLYDDHGGESYEGEDRRLRDLHYPGYDPGFPYHDPRRPPDHRRDGASHPHHSSHPHDLAHAHLTNTPHAHPSAAHETRAADPSYNVAEPPPHHHHHHLHSLDTDPLEGEIPDTDRPLTPRVRHSSSVSINEHPEYFEFDANSPPSTEPRADADVDPSSNPASEFSHRITAFGPTGVSIGGASKRGQLGRSLSTSEVPETEKAEEEAQGENKEAGESHDDPGAAEAVEGKPEGGADAKQGCEEGEVVEEEEEEAVKEEEEGEEAVEVEQEEEEVDCPEGEYSAEGSTSPQEAVAGGSAAGPSSERMEGSLSDSATGMLTVDGKERRRVTNGKQGPAGGLSKKSSSTSKLSDTGRKRKIGFRKNTRSQITVHRSEEILPTGSRHLMRQSSSQSSEEAEGEDSRVPSVRLGTDGQLSEFIEGLGQGQLVGRQVLATPALGDIQLSMCDRKNKLEVEVIRARGLQCKTGARVLPAPYVKVYLVAGKKCVAKAKTATARRTLDPLYQQQLIFHERYQGCVLQVTVWGDYGRMEGRKVFMGLAQIMLDDLDLSNIVIGWYKLFGTSSLVSLPTLTRRGSMASLDSFG
ncbi:uncharacterized protein LOC126999677 isoform X3 [Eriocheir sinensis]|uniref:uncharacterized protein LOC126999677 isoform X3 n=1 Tax=Eriocheir sinensis TaxID=95602 RepID=UPI0021C99E4B|nr:uncharacterized protein LOC126999677 isoform X3 [Eriocheir sinensis]